MRKFWLVLLSSFMTLASSAMAVAPLNVSITPGTPIYFKSDDNRREQFVDVKLPDNIAAYGRVALHFKLTCPDGKCDAWDRTGSFGIVDKSTQQYNELLRFITPYGIGADWQFDLSDFLPLLQGQKTFKIFIDTWVGPGHPQGNGWLVEADLTYGEPDGRPVAAYVQPVLSFADIIYGDPLKTSERSGPILPLLGYTAAQLYVVVTGHGQGNEQNCAEFCAKTHKVTIGSETYEKRIWRDDCATTVDPKQKGNWRYPRAGWCPGDKVEAWKTDVTSALQAGATTLSYQPEAFDNSCRPGSADCKTCVFGTGCEYDGGMHTEPRYFVSAYIVYYK